MQNEKFFSTGSNPVEMLMPMFHLDNTGFQFDVATLSGNPVKLELWAMPLVLHVVLETYKKYEKQLKAPLKCKLLDKSATHSCSWSTTHSYSKSATQIKKNKLLFLRKDFLSVRPA